MLFHQTSLSGLIKIEVEPRGDSRGYLARTYCEQEFAAQDLNTKWPQCNHTRTTLRGSIRGMHFQADPSPEIKLIRCVRGTILDVLVDVRKNSPTFGRWISFELSSENATQLYVPGGFAHGFQCLEDNCEVFYMMSEFYIPELAQGLRHDDPEVGITWPLPLADISDRDLALPLLHQLQ